MKHNITINMTIDDGTAFVESLDVCEGYARTEFVTDGIDNPISLNEAIRCISEEIKWNYL